MNKELKSLTEQRNLNLIERLGLAQENFEVKQNAETKAQAFSNSNLNDLQKAEKISQITNHYNNYYAGFLQKAQEYTSTIKGIEQRITEIIEDKKQCVACIIHGGESGKILFLKRTNNDDFHPGTWCLPGGGVEIGENPFLSVVREVQEEAGFTINTPKLVSTIDLDDCIIYYFEIWVDEDKLTILDEKEHANYVWASYEEWKNLDLIIDLKEHLCCTLGYDFNPSIFQSTLNIINDALLTGEKRALETDFDYIEKAFKAGKVSEDIYKQAFDTLLIKGGFKVGTVRHYADGSSYRKVKDTGGSGDWARIVEGESPPIDTHIKVEEKDFVVEAPGVDGFSEVTYSDEEVPVALIDNPLPELTIQPDMSSHLWVSKRERFGDEEGYFREKKWGPNDWVEKFNLFDKNKNNIGYLEKVTPVGGTMSMNPYYDWNAFDINGDEVAHGEDRKKDAISALEKHYKELYNLDKND